MSDVFDQILNRAKNSNMRIVLTESEDERVIDAVSAASKLGICKIILLGDKSVKEKFEGNSMVEVIDHNEKNEKREAYINLLYELRKAKGMTLEMAEKEVSNKLIFANLMLRAGDADGIVSGAITHTADVLRPAFQITKMAEGVSKASSVFVMESPNDNFGENGFMVLGDCGVNPCPTAEDLAEIAILSAKTARNLCGINPRVALLTYSTKSGDEMTDENVVKVKKALEIVKEKEPDLMIDGELQADAAIVPEVAKLKCPNSPIKGRANVLIFPDLNAGNIGYKLVQRLAGVKAVGPIMQGLRKPVNDLSRGTSVDEIVLAMAITAIQAKGE